MPKRFSFSLFKSVFFFIAFVGPSQGRLFQMSCPVISHYDRLFQMSQQCNFIIITNCYDSSHNFTCHNSHCYTLLTGPHMKWPSIHYVCTIHHLIGWRRITNDLSDNVNNTFTCPSVHLTPLV